MKWQPEQLKSKESMNITHEHLLIDTQDLVIVSRDSVIVSHCAYCIT